MGKIKDWILGVLVKKYALGYLVSAWRLAEGKKTQIAMSLMLIVWVGEVSGFIPKELAAQIYGILGPIAGVTFLDKLRRFQKPAEKVADAVKMEAVRGIAEK